MNRIVVIKIPKKVTDVKRYATPDTLPTKSKKFRLRSEQEVMEHRAGVTVEQTRLWLTQKQ